MIWYVGLVAILNLALGYGLAVFLGTGRRRARQQSAGYDDAELDAALDHDLSDSSHSTANATENEFSLESAPPLVASLPPMSDDADPVTGLITRDRVEQQLSDLTLAHADLQPMTVALLGLDEAASGADALDDRLLRGVADTICELLSDVHTAARYSDRQFLVLLPHDDLQHASQRTEQLRQRVAATQYVRDGQPIQATITCAVTQMAATHSVVDLLEYLEETLDEARRFGGNRTFMHDGISPAPVVPPELNLAQQTCAI